MLWTQFPLGTRPRTFGSKFSLLKPLSRQVSPAKKLELSEGSSAGWESSCVGRGTWCRDRDVPNVQRIFPSMVSSYSQLFTVRLLDISG